MIPNISRTISRPCTGANKHSKQTAKRWHAVSSLLAPLSQHSEMEKLFTALEKVRPLSRKHRHSLGADINDLSRLLTCARGELRAPYWRNPAYISAYLYYFLPWNIIRLGRLLASLPLSDPNTLESPLLLDAGSGPLTLPLALWLFKPEWRQLPIHIAALDAARQPLELGNAIMQELAATLHQPPWQTTLITGPLVALGSFKPEKRQPWLISATNVLNEIKFRRHGPMTDNDDPEDFPHASLLDAWQPLLKKTASPALLFVEPGTRLGSSAIMRMRQAALGAGFAAASPCTHQNACPLLAKSGSWCHFVFSAQDAPGWLKTISHEAHLSKASLSLSPLLLAQHPPANKWPQNSLPTRIVSQDFNVRGFSAHYGCNNKGLCLLPNSGCLYSGSLCLAAQPEPEPEIDSKSGAIVLSPYASAI